MQLKPCARPPIPCLQYACHHAAKPDLAEHIPAFTHGPSGHATLQMCRATLPACGHACHECRRPLPPQSSTAFTHGVAALRPESRIAGYPATTPNLPAAPHCLHAWSVHRWPCMLKHQIHPPAIHGRPINLHSAERRGPCGHPSVRARSLCPRPPPHPPPTRPGGPPCETFQKTHFMSAHHARLQPACAADPPCACSLPSEAGHGRACQWLGGQAGAGVQLAPALLQRRRRAQPLHKVQLPPWKTAQIA